MSDRVWDLFVELRKELLESQRIRAQVIGFKIAFVSVGTGLIATRLPDFDSALLVIPAFAAIFFDFLIHSYSFSIDRIGGYVREHIEPALSKLGHMPEDFVQWQRFLTQRSTRQRLSLLGNFGLTLLAVAVGVASLLFPYRPMVSLPLLAALIVFAAGDVASSRRPFKLWTDELDPPQAA